MAQVYILEFKYNLEKRLPSKRVWRAASKERIPSFLSRTYQPNADEMKKVFDKIDSDNDGKISRWDLKKLLTLLRKENLCVKADKIVQAADFDCDGYINFKDFMELHKKGGGIRAQEIQSAFLMYDLDGDGKIGVGDLQGMLHRLGESCSDVECERIVEKVDSDGDGLVDMEDFMKMMTETMKLSSN